MSGQILLVGEHSGGALAPVSFEMVSVAKAHAARTGQSTAACLVGPAGVAALAPQLLASGVGEVYVLEHPRLEGAETGALVRALEAVCRKAQPDLVLVGQTSSGRDIAPALAQRLGGGVVMNGVEIKAGAAGEVEVVCPVFGGAARAVYRFGGARPFVVGFQARIAERASASGTPDGKVTQVEAGFLDGFTPRTKVRGRSVASGPQLEDARVIVAGGLGLGEKDNFKYIDELAGILGGLPAASRPLVDRGWVTSALQVGLTGKVVAPELYFAVGISGASQHLAGMSSAKTIIAVNSDPRATIFTYAKYGVVADCLEFMPAFIEACRKLPRAG